MQSRRAPRTASRPEEPTITPEPPPALPSGLALTGERTGPDAWHEGYWFARHVAAYTSFAPLCTGRRVLEAGSGEGYGPDLLARSGARDVVGLDYDGAATAHARRRYGDRAAFARANLVRLPIADAGVEVVLSLQVLEHIWTPDELLAEVRRVLVPGGLLALTTPSRRTFSPGLGRGERPANLFHEREYDAEELVGLVGRHLDVVRLAGVHAGEWLRDLDRRFGSFVAAQLAAEPAGWSPELAAAVRSVRPEHFEVRDAGPDADPDDALDLLVVARRPEAG